MKTGGEAERYERIAARAMALGVGLLVFMTTWSLGSPMAERLVDQPAAAFTAMSVAIVLGSVAVVIAIRRPAPGAR